MYFGIYAFYTHGTRKLVKTAMVSNLPYHLFKLSDRIITLSLTHSLSLSLSHVCTFTLVAVFLNMASSCGNNPSKWTLCTILQLRSSSKQQWEKQVSLTYKLRTRALLTKPIYIFDFILHSGWLCWLNITHTSVSSTCAHFVCLFVFWFKVAERRPIHQHKSFQKTHTYHTHARQDSRRIYNVYK